MLDKLRNQYSELSIEKIKNNARDNLSLSILIFAGALLFFSGLSAVRQNYNLLKKISALQQENEVISIENRNKELKNVYYASPEFAEIKARRVNGKAAVGEKIYIISDDVALSALKTKGVPETQSTTDGKPFYQKNFQAWTSFFFKSK